MFALTARPIRGRLFLFTLFFVHLFAKTTCSPNFVGVNDYLLNIASEVIYELEVEGCCTTEYPAPGAADSHDKGAKGGGDKITPCVLGHIASYYYLSYRSVGLFDRM